MRLNRTLSHWKFNFKNSRRRGAGKFTRSLNVQHTLYKFVSVLLYKQEFSEFIRAGIWLWRVTKPLLKWKPQARCQTINSVWIYFKTLWELVFKKASSKNALKFCHAVYAWWEILNGFICRYVQTRALPLSRGSSQWGLVTVTTAWATCPECVLGRLWRVCILMFITHTQT